MVKRILAFLIVAVMITSLIACDNSKKPGPGGNTPGNESTDGTSDETKAPETSKKDEETKAPDKVYQPNADCKFIGKVGVGAVGGTVYFDDIKVNDRGPSNMELIPTNGFEGEPEVPAFTGLASADAVTPEIVADPLKPENNKALSVSDGTVLITGDKIWNYYQYGMKVLLADENAQADIYFAVTDDKNYFVLSLGEQGNTKATCYKVTDGKKENAQFTVPLTLDLEKWTTIGVNINVDTITIFVSGSTILDLYNPEMVNDYYDYNGTVIPASIAQAGLGAPAENAQFYEVKPEQVIHDGKGTWGDNGANVATNAFDMDRTTFYDCDEKLDTPLDTKVNSVNVGIPGDGKFATGYVGVKFDAPTKVSHFRYCARSANLDRMAGGILQGSNDGENWTDLYTIPSDAVCVADKFYTVALEEEAEFTYYRYVGATEKYCNISELELWYAAK